MASSKKQSGPRPAAGANAKTAKPKSQPRPQPRPPQRKPQALVGSGAPLVAVVDGVALPDAEGEALWRAFSEHMDQHQGDLAGFARSRGFASVKPEHRNGQAVLVVATR